MNAAMNQATTPAIPEGIVEATAAATRPELWSDQPGYRHAHNARTETRAAVRAILEAAAPFLLGSEIARADRLYEHSRILTAKLERVRRVCEAAGYERVIAVLDDESDQS